MPEATMMSSRNASVATALSYLRQARANLKSVPPGQATTRAVSESMIHLGGLENKIEKEGIKRPVLDSVPRNSPFQKA